MFHKSNQHLISCLRSAIFHRFCVKFQSLFGFTARKGLWLRCQRLFGNQLSLWLWLTSLTTNCFGGQVWSSIASSLAKWSDSKKARYRRLLELRAAKNNTHRRHRRRRDEETVCYKNFGCFKDEGPFDYLDTLPASPEAISTTFTLYTRQHSVDGQKLEYENITSLLKSSFNASNPIKIIIHGFGSSGKRPWVLQMTEAFLFMVRPPWRMSSVLTVGPPRTIWTWSWWTGRTGPLCPTMSRPQPTLSWSANRLLFSFGW